MKYFLISDNIDTQIGMRLAGIEGVVAHTEQEIVEEFNECLKDNEIAIVLVTEKIMDLSRGFLSVHKSNAKRPLIVEIPDRHGSTRSNDYIMEHVKEAIGISL